MKSKQKTEQSYKTQAFVFFLIARTIKIIKCYCSRDIGFPSSGGDQEVGDLSVAWVYGLDSMGGGGPGVEGSRGGRATMVINTVHS